MGEREASEEVTVTAMATLFVLCIILDERDWSVPHSVLLSAAVSSRTILQDTVGCRGCTVLLWRVGMGWWNI